MVTLSKKVLVFLVITPLIVFGVAIAAILNIGGIGTALAGFGGPFGRGVLNILTAPLAWAITGGGPTIAVFWALIAFGIFGFAYWVWHWDIGYKLSSNMATKSPADGYDNSVRTEPAEPERSKTVVTK